MNAKSESSTVRPGCVLVVGGSGGLGRAVCEDFARKGRPVAFTFHANRARAKAVAVSLGECLFDAVDLTKPGKISSFVTRAAARFGGIAAVVYAAGPDIAQPYVGDISLGQWRATIDADVNGFFSVAQAIIPIFRAQKDGVLVAITTAATRRYPPRDALSAVPKAAIEQLVKAIAKEEGRFGIRANCVAPGMIDAGLGARMLSRDYSPDVTDAFRRAVPLRRFGSASEIAAVVSFLASSDAAYISGQVIAVDGGWQL